MSGRSRSSSARFAPRGNGPRRRGAHATISSVAPGAATAGGAIHVGQLHTYGENARFTGPVSESYPVQATASVVAIDSLTPEPR